MCCFQADSCLSLRIIYSSLHTECRPPVTGFLHVGRPAALALLAVALTLVITVVNNLTYFHKSEFARTAYGPTDINVTYAGLQPLALHLFRDSQQPQMGTVFPCFGRPQLFCSVCRRIPGGAGQRPSLF